MKREEPKTVGELLDEFFRSRRGPAAAAVEGRAMEIWREVAGEYVVQSTEDAYLREGVLYVSFSSASVRAEVMMRRRWIVEQINDRLGTRVVKNLVLR